MGVVNIVGNSVCWPLCLFVDSSRCCGVPSDSMAEA